MRIIFAGTPDFAASHLSFLLENLDQLPDGSEVIAVYTQPDRKAGRGKKLLPPPVKQLALAANIPVFQPASLKTEEEHRHLIELEADIMIVAAYGMLLPETVLSIPRHGCINVHASLLPRWRGAAPIERCLLAGDKQSGVTIMQMDVGLDTGDMLRKSECNIDASETGDSLREKLVQLGCNSLLETINLIAGNAVVATVQDNDKATYASKLEKHEGEINWQESAHQIATRVRAFTSALACFSILNGERIRFLRAEAIDSSKKAGLAEPTSIAPGTILAISDKGIEIACGGDDTQGNSGSVLLVSYIQLPGKKPVSIRDALNGRADLLSCGQQFAMPEKVDGTAGLLC